MCSANVDQESEKQENPQQIKKIIQQVKNVSSEGNIEIHQTHIDRVDRYVESSPAPKKIPISWGLPLHKEHFVKRTRFIRKINERLSTETLESNKPIVLTGIHGLGGVGKTCLALYTLYHTAHQYGFKCWIEAQYEENIETTYIKLGQAVLELSLENLTHEDKLMRVRNQLERIPEGCLLVYDNAESYAVLKKYLPRTGCHILVTSRNPNWPHGSISIDVMEEKEAVALVTGIVQRTLPEEDIKQLVNTLGRLPLAISQASAYINVRKRSIKHYLRDYQKSKKKYLSSTLTPVGDEKQLPVFITWDMSLKKIEAQSTRAVSLLNICSYLNATNIPCKLLERYIEGECAEDELSEELSFLESYSMIQFTEQGVSLHRLVQDVMREKQSKAIKIETTKIIISMIKKVYPWENSTMKAYKFRVDLISHIEKILSHIKDLSYESKEIDCARLQDILGDTYDYLGNYVRKKECFEKALHLRKQYYNEEPKHREIASTLVDLGSAVGDLGDYKCSRKLLEEALGILKQYYKKDPEHIEIGVALETLGVTHSSLGNYACSKKLLEEALQIKKKHYKKENIGIGITFGNLGIVYGNLGKYKRSKEYLEKALHIKKKHYKENPEHVEIGTALANLGVVYGRLEEYESSKECLEKALLIKEKHYGKNSKHIDVAGVLESLGNVYRELGEYEGSKELLEKALSIFEQYYGQEHTQVARVLENLGNVYRALGEYESSKELLEKALSIFEQHHNSKHISIGIVLENLGAIYSSLRDYAHQKELLEEALRIKKKHYAQDPEHIEIGRTLGNLGNAYGALGDYARKKELLEKTLLIKKKYYAKNPGHIKIGITLENLGNTYGDLGDYARQKELLEEALLIHKKYYEQDPEHIHIGITLGNLGFAYFSLGNYDQAEQSYMAALKSVKDRQVLLKRSVQSGLGLICFQRHQFDQANKYFEDSLKNCTNKNEQCVIYLMQGIGFTLLNSYDRATRCFDMILQANPTDSGALYHKKKMRERQREATVVPNKDSGKPVTNLDSSAAGFWKSESKCQNRSGTGTLSKTTSKRAIKGQSSLKEKQTTTDKKITEENTDNPLCQSK